MPATSLFEQLTSNVSLSILGIVSGTILVLLLIYTVACRIFFSSPKSKASPLKSQENKERKGKESSIAKKQQIDTVSNNKKKNNKAKKGVLPVASASSPSTQSEESENDKTPIISSSKKTPTSVNVSANKKVAVADENKKNNSSANENKQSTIKQEQKEKQDIVHPENIERSNEDNKSKQIKSNRATTSNKQKTPEKRDGTTSKNNLSNSKKNESSVNNSEIQRTFTSDGQDGSDQEDDGQWLTQSSKQLNHRHRNKGKIETSSNTNQSLSSHTIVSEQRLIPTTAEVIVSSSINADEFYMETKHPSNNSTSLIDNPEPIEIYQLLPKNESLYTANDNWWKHALNKKQAFSIDDIGEWPECEQDDQYIIQIKQIIPAKKLTENQISYEL